MLAIDPGTTQSAWCLFDGNRNRVINSGIESNSMMLELLGGETSVAIEMVACYGMPVGKEVFETCVWIGRFIQQLESNGITPTLVYRKDVKLHLCQSPRAKDANIRQAIIDRFEPTGGGKIPQIGTKAKPGPLYGVRSHIWAALAVAIYQREIGKP